MNQLSDATPLMKQFYAIKEQYPDALILFQVGDFYELFFDDAKTAASVLAIALTKRGKINGDPIPLCGVPVHALDHYLAKLIKAGYKVALCNQLEEPKPGKVVRRGITQVFTPGTLTDSRLLDAKSASYLLSFYPDQDSYGLLFAELMTAQLFATSIARESHKNIEAELIRYFPDEIIIPDLPESKSLSVQFKHLGYTVTVIGGYDENLFRQWLESQFCIQTRSLIAEKNSIGHALNYFYSFLYKNHESALSQFKTIHWYEPDDFLILDRSTQINLELIKNNHDGTAKHSLLSVLDGAITAMGSRMIKKWIMRPLVKKEAIIQRQSIIQNFLHNIVATQELEQLLHEIADFERVVGRITLSRAQLADFLQLKRVLELLPQLCVVLQAVETTIFLPQLISIAQHCLPALNLLQSALLDELGDYIIKPGYNQQLDHLRDLVANGAQKILDLETAEQQKTGIGSLKIRFNQIHNYYIEITKTHSNSIPDHYIRQQTLVGKERYTTKELQALQNEILTAQQNIAFQEKQIFEQVKQQIYGYSNSLRKLANLLANLDALVGLARVAYKNRYTKPSFHDSTQSIIVDGKHPIVEQVIGHSFIPNDTLLNDEQRTMIITGPNMGGKSTYLRQVALIHIMGQIGSYVPAKSALLPIIDRVFTRIGAGDNLSSGKSTFLVEMEETALICTNATARSLVILDEVGRGTSTYDGLAIAQAVLEYIHTYIKAHCLFATHYQELTCLKDQLAGIACFYASSKRTGRGIQFLYKMVSGIAEGSFGIEVAKLASLPPLVIARSQEILQTLQQSTVIPISGANDDQMQLIAQLQQSLTQIHDATQFLQEIDFDQLSPKAAFDLLWNYKMQQMR